MASRRLMMLVLAGALFASLPNVGGATTPKTIRLTLAHVVAHCHVWRTPAKLLGPTLKLTVAPGTRVVIRPDCPMDFQLAQTKGPRLALGDPLLYAGTSRTVTFRKAGVYRLTAVNVQTPEERGLTVLGDANTLTLTVVVK